jgi:hypothetical protein
MLIGLRQPKTKANMKTNAQLDSSAPTLANTMLAEVFVADCPTQDELDSVKRKVLSGKKFYNKTLSNASNCYYIRGKDVIQVGSCFDLEGLSCPYFITKIENNVVFVHHVYFDQAFSFNLCDLTFV